MSCSNTGSIEAPTCADTCCMSMFGSPRERLAGDVAGIDLCTGQVVFANDHPREYWRAKGREGDRTLVCLHCLRSSPSSERVLVYYEVERGRAFFRHGPGESPEGAGVSGESQWHQGVKHSFARWARTQSAVSDVRVEWTLPSGSRRTDVLVELRSGRRFAVEVQYSPIDASLHADRQRDYREAGVTPIWLYSIALAAPLWAGDNLTFGVRLGPLDKQGRSMGHRLEFGVPFSKPNSVDSWTAASLEDFMEYTHFNSGARKGVMWVPASAATLTEVGITVPGDPVASRRRHGIVTARMAADEHNTARDERKREEQQRSLERFAAGRAERGHRKASTVPRSTGFTCDGCGAPLSPILQQQGRHYGC
ncbi:hypothetical protein Br6_04830 [Rhodococcus sp. Br-6]|nr:hypothetical protein Br6_04830 [Rhodococcus sp. Br-6]